MKIYEIIDKEYINYLSKVDFRVSYLKANDQKSSGRKYLGVFAMIDGIDYLIPLTRKIKKNKFFSLAIIENNKKIASILVNNMIPINKQHREQICKPVEINSLINSDDIKKQEYGFFLKNELNYINSIEEKILKRANDIYNHKIPYKLKNTYNNVCCDFKKLEKAAINYKPLDQNK